MTMRRRIARRLRLLANRIDPGAAARPRIGMNPVNTTSGTTTYTPKEG